MRVETSSYQFSHRRKPSGFGVWFFRVTVNGTDHVVQHGGEYVAAKRVVKGFVIGLGVKPHEAKVAVMA